MKHYLITYRAEYEAYHNYETEVVNDLEAAIFWLRKNTRCDCTILCIQEISEELYNKLR